MKRKIQHNAVNNQEDEDSCAYTICLTTDAPVAKKEDNPIGESSGDHFNEASSNKDESPSSQE
jgi:hypothetical protein